VSNYWRTETVVALCQAMRETRDYSATPILADALEEAGYGDEKVLSQLRGSLSHGEAERLVALIYSDKTAEAVKRLEEIAAWLGPGSIYELGEGYGEKIPMDYKRLMDAAGRWIESEDSTTQHGWESWRDSFPSRAREFWEQYQIITGRKPPDDTASFFHCSC
jgi:hypothetical protein